MHHLCRSIIRVIAQALMIALCATPAAWGQRDVEKTLLLSRENVTACETPPQFRRHFMQLTLAEKLDLRMPFAPPLPQEGPPVPDLDELLENVRRQKPLWIARPAEIVSPVTLEKLRKVYQLNPTFAMRCDEKPAKVSAFARCLGIVDLFNPLLDLLL